VHASLGELHGRLGSALEDSFKSVPPYAANASAVRSPLAEQTTQQVAAPTPQQPEQSVQPDEPAQLEHSTSAAGPASQ
jgi:hypothetical protein